MALAITSTEALWFAPLAVPICFYVAYTDCRMMKITNYAVMALLAVFVIVGLIALPFNEWMWRLVHVVAVLVFGMALNAGGAIGAGDAKFCAAAAPFIVLADLTFVMVLLAACLLAAFATHRLAKFTPLRKLAPEWESWNRGPDFPMGLALGPTLGIYLLIGIFAGSGA